MRTVRVNADSNSYVDTPFVAERTEETLDWVHSEIERKELNTIVLSGLAYQRLVSIHPFSNGNGRTCRLVMDYILRGNGYPPSCMEDHDVALFSFPQDVKINEKAYPAAEKAVVGVANTLRLMGVVGEDEFNKYKKRFS